MTDEKDKALWYDSCFACGSPDSKEWMGWGISICEACKAVAPIKKLHEWVLADITKNELRNVVLSARFAADAERDAARAQVEE